MPESLNQWHAEHVNFAQLLALFERELARFHEGERPNYELIRITSYNVCYTKLLRGPRSSGT